MQASLFGIVVLRLELFLAPWLIIDPLCCFVGIAGDGVWKIKQFVRLPCHAICMLFSLIPTVFALSLC